MHSSRAWLYVGGYAHQRLGFSLRSTIAITRYCNSLPLALLTHHPTIQKISAMLCSATGCYYPSSRTYCKDRKSPSSGSLQRHLARPRLRICTLNFKTHRCYYCDNPNVAGTNYYIGRRLMISHSRSMLKTCLLNEILDTSINSGCTNTRQAGLLLHGPLVQNYSMLFYSTC